MYGSQWLSPFIKHCYYQILHVGNLSIKFKCIMTPNIILCKYSVFSINIYTYSKYIKIMLFICKLLVIDQHFTLFRYNKNQE